VASRYSSYSRIVQRRNYHYIDAMRYTLLLAMVMLPATACFAQASRVTYNSQLVCESIADASMDVPSTGYPAFPGNVRISFTNNVNPHDSLRSASAEVSKNGVRIRLLSDGTSRILNVNLSVVNDHVSCSISEWSPFGKRILKPQTVTLTLKDKNFKKGNRLIGEIHARFGGQLSDDCNGAPCDTDVTGEINGCFNIVIDKLFVPRH